MHVYHFILDHRIGGPHVYVNTLIKGLGPNIDTTIVTTGRGAMTEKALVNLRHYWAPLYLLEVVVNVLLLVGAIFVAPKSRKNVLFHVHGGANIAPLLAARCAGIPVVWHMHETTTEYESLVSIGKLILKRSNFVLAAVAQKSIDVYGLTGAILLPATVDPAFWSQDAEDKSNNVIPEWREPVSAEKSILKMLVVANLNPLKGIDILLEALAGVEGQWHLKILGSELATHKDYAGALYIAANKLLEGHSESSIEFLGWQGKEVVRSQLATCDLFILPSRSEACPIALLEAVAMGCCCAAADVGDVRVLLAGVENGKVFQADDIADCRDAILVVRDSYVTKNNRSSDIGYDWRFSTVLARTERIYEELLGLGE